MTDETTGETTQATQVNETIKPFMRRIIDLTRPNVPPEDSGDRMDDRQNRSIPVIIAPLEQGIVRLEDATRAVTKDISTSGMSIVLHQPFRADQVVMGLYVAEEVHLFSGRVQQMVPLGGGYWVMGVEAELPISNQGQPWQVDLVNRVGELRAKREYEALPTRVAVTE